MIEEAADTLDPDALADRVMDDMRLLTREEWFEIARKAGQGGFGFGPVRQLQLRIRDRPITFGPQLFAIFVNATEVLYRQLPWPKPQGWRIAKRWQNSGWAKKKGLDPEPYRAIDPLLDEWDRVEAEKGPESPATKRIVAQLIHLCLHENKS